MMPVEGPIITANYVPNPGKAAASAFRKWDEGFTIDLNKERNECG